VRPRIAVTGYGANINTFSLRRMQHENIRSSGSRYPFALVRRSEP
jgi:hypothetical protein